MLPLNIGFKTNLVTDMADEFLKKSLHYTSPFQVDYLKLFTPVATVGVYYVLYSVMRMITEMGAQYAVKVSYSKDRVGCVLCRNYCSSRGLIPSGSYRKMFTKPRTWRYSRHHHDQGWLIWARRMRTDCGESPAWTLIRLSSSTTSRSSGTSTWSRSSLPKYLSLTQRLNLWDKSYYGYNRPEGEEMNRQWRKSVLESFDQEALPKPKPKNAAHAQSKANPKSHKEYKAKTHDKTKEKTESEIHTDPKTAPEATANSKV